MLIGDSSLIIAAVGGRAIQPGILSSRRRNTICVPVIEDEGPVKLVFALLDKEQSLGIKATVLSTNVDFFGADEPKFQAIRPGGFLEAPAPPDYPCRIVLSFKADGFVVAIGQLHYGQSSDFRLVLDDDTSTCPLTRLPGTTTEEVIDFLRKGDYKKN
jgi:hypothetical protein